MLKISLQVLRIKNAKFSDYCFYMNTNIQGGFRICISVPFNVDKKYLDTLLSKKWGYKKVLRG